MMAIGCGLYLLVLLCSMCTKSRRLGYEWGVLCKCGTGAGAGRTAPVLVISGYCTPVSRLVLYNTQRAALGRKYRNTLVDIVEGLRRAASESSQFEAAVLMVLVDEAKYELTQA